MSPSALLKQVFLMTWLWSIFAGFYLVAYVFWVPNLFAGILVPLAVGLPTLVLGAGLLLDGFSKALELQGAPKGPTLPWRRARQVLGGAVLLAYLLVYLPPGGRIVAHWPLDLAITVVSGVVVIAYGIMDK